MWYNISRRSYYETNGDYIEEGDPPGYYPYNANYFNDIDQTETLIPYTGPLQGNGGDDNDDGMGGIDYNGGIGCIVETQKFASLRSDHDVSNQKDSNRNKTTQPKNKFGPQSKNLASIIRGYKTGVTKYTTINKLNFAWQTRFHDRIIRNDTEFRRISNYIINNPKNWNEDEFFNDE